jgi:hypothetical protein
MIRSFKKPSGQALALNPYIVENPAGVQFQFVILYAGGQVNGHKVTLYFTLS